MKMLSEIQPCIPCAATGRSMERAFVCLTCQGRGYLVLNKTEPVNTDRLRHCAESVLVSVKNPRSRLGLVTSELERQRNRHGELLVEEFGRLQSIEMGYSKTPLLDAYFESLSE